MDSTNQRLVKAGIKTIRTHHFDAFGKVTYLEYKGQQVRRPRSPSQCIELVKEVWGVKA